VKKEKKQRSLTLKQLLIRLKLFQSLKISLNDIIEYFETIERI